MKPDAKMSAEQEEQKCRLRSDTFGLNYIIDPQLSERELSTSTSFKSMLVLYCKFKKQSNMNKEKNDQH